MTTFETRHRVTYSETDMMGFMHHSNYLRWYENGRWELFRHLGISYASVEGEGYIFPVTGAELRYFHPLTYDQEAVVITRVSSVSGARITFDYEVRDLEGLVMSKARIRVGCASRESGRAAPLPLKVREAISTL